MPTRTEPGRRAGWAELSDTPGGERRGGEIVTMPTRTEPGRIAGWAELSDAPGGKRRGGGDSDHADQN